MTNTRLETIAQTFRFVVRQIIQHIKSADDLTALQGIREGVEARVSDLTVSEYQYGLNIIAEDLAADSTRYRILRRIAQRHGWREDESETQLMLRAAQSDDAEALKALRHFIEPPRILDHITGLRFAG